MSSRIKFSIKKKLTVIIMMVSALALLLASAAFIIYDTSVFKEGMITELNTLAEIIGNNSTAAITFDDQATAREILSALKVKSNILYAAIMQNDMPMAAYYRDKTESVHPVLKSQGHLFFENRIAVFKDVIFKDKKIGGVYIESDLGEIALRLKHYFTAIVFIIIMVSVVIFFISSGMQGSISGPILELVRITKRVSETDNYSIEVRKQSNDEIGQLFDEFNNMMKKIQSRDVLLTQAKVELEERVQDRTEELRKRLAELEQFNKVSTGRELRMIELKQGINQLSIKLNLKEPYDLAFLKDENT
jgi:nitrogen fixation/metabolism regulation signal transduction histidine kinase